MSGDAVPPGSPAANREATAAQLADLAARLAERGAPALAAIPLERRLEVWCDAIAALLDPESAERRSLMPALVESSRLSAEGLCEGLEVVLGGAAERPARELAARVGRGSIDGYAGVVLAGNLPGLAAQAVLPALLVGRPLLLKSAVDEPRFAPALVAALARREPALGEGFAAVAFRGADEAGLRAAFGDARRVLAYGGAPAIEALRSVLGARLVAHGPKASVALVAADVDPLLAARKLARDIALFDQRGCLSVQAIYVEGDPAPLLDALGWALALEHRRLPSGPIAFETAALVQQLRGEWALRGLPSSDLAVAAGTVLVDPETRFVPSPGARTVRLHPVSGFAPVLAALAPWRDRLQGAALAGAAAWSVAPELEALGLSRLAQPGELQLADAGWRNGGVDPLSVFL